MCIMFETIHADGHEQTSMFRDALFCLFVLEIRSQKVQTRSRQSYAYAFFRPEHFGEFRMFLTQKPSYRSHGGLRGGRSRGLKRSNRCEFPTRGRTRVNSTNAAPRSTACYRYVVQIIVTRITHSARVRYARASFSICTGHKSPTVRSRRFTSSTRPIVFARNTPGGAFRNTRLSARRNAFFFPPRPQRVQITHERAAFDTSRGIVANARSRRR